MKGPLTTWRRSVVALGLSAGVAVAYALAGTPVTATAAPGSGQILNAGAPAAVAGSYIVVLKDTPLSAARGTATAAKAVSSTAASLAAAHGGTVGRVYSSALRGFSVRMSEPEARRLAADPAVDYVEQNQRVTLAETQTNPPSWGLDRVDQRNLPLDHAYTYPAQGAHVTAYIVDTGIRFSHQDFGGRATSGFDAVDGGSADDCDGHGTHVAGTVGSATYGIAKQVSLVSVRVFPCTGQASSWEAVIAGVDWVAAHAVKPAVANMSLGGVSTAMDQATANLVASGVTVAVSAGNSNLDACSQSPARVPAAITVGATTSTDARASYSNFGTCVDIFAPGSDITSTDFSGDTATSVKSGTSMATPHVAGAAALVLSVNPSYTPAQVRDYLVNNATPGVVTDPGSGSPNKLLYARNLGTAACQSVSLDLTAYPQLASGATGTPVKVAQCLLKALGIDTSGDLPSGTFDSATVTAVNTFQTAHGLPVTGVVDSHTWTALLSAGTQPTLASGSSGADVRRLQRSLTAALGRTVPIDGSFGPQTKTAVTDYQSSRGLKADGAVGPLTWTALQAGR